MQINVFNGETSLSAEPGLVAAEEAAFVERAAEDEMAVFGIDLAVVEPTGLGVENLAADELVMFLIVRHAANDDESDDGCVMVFVLAGLALKVGAVHEHLGYLAVIESVRTLIDGNDCTYFAGFVIDCLPFAKDGRELCGRRYSQQQKA